MRQAQNDVLAAVGAVVRKDDERSGNDKKRQNEIINSRRKCSTEKAIFFKMLRDAIIHSCSCGWIRLLTDQLAVSTMQQLILRYLTQLQVTYFPTDMSMLDIALFLYEDLGPFNFFLGKVPLYLLDFVCFELYKFLDSMIDLEGQLTRIIIALVKSRAIRDSYHKKVRPALRYP